MTARHRSHRPRNAAKVHKHTCVPHASHPHRLAHRLANTSSNIHTTQLLPPPRPRRSRTRKRELPACSVLTAVNLFPLLRAVMYTSLPSRENISPSQTIRTSYVCLPFRPSFMSVRSYAAWRRCPLIKTYGGDHTYATF
jgi:hypothetical protein